MNGYDDIINLERPISKKHKPMSIYNRAAQFSPFAALTGYDGIIKETGRETASRIELDEYEKAEINMLLQELKQHKEKEVKILYFMADAKKEGGEYLVWQGLLKKIDEDRGLLITFDGNSIAIKDIVSMELI